MTATFEPSGDGGNEREPEQKSAELIDLLIAHDTKNDSLKELILELVEKPETLGDDTVKAMNFRANNAITSWKNVLEALQSGNGLFKDSFIESVSTIWMADDTKRVELLNEKIPDGKFMIVEKGDWKALKKSINSGLENFLEDVEDNFKDDATVEYLVNQYAVSIEKDLTQFILHIQNAKYEKSLEKSPEAASSFQEKLKTLLPVLGAYALDITKLAAGVSIGIVLGNAVKGRRK